MKNSLSGLGLFQGAEHQSFAWFGGRPGALLIHGFPGTPAELHPLGKSLHQAGWTVHGPLLPGFGTQIETLFERHYFEWINAVQKAIMELQRDHNPVLLVGYSAGAALALQVAANHPPAGLVLLAPFWQVATGWQKIAGILLRPFFRQIRPFKKADFSDPKMRHGVNNLLPDVDLDDPAVQQALRELSVPVKIFEQLHQVGQGAFQSASKIAVPTLVIQGTQDETVRPANTRRLALRFPRPAHYLEVAVGHDLINPDQQAWSQVEYTVLNFAKTLVSLDAEVLK